MTERLDLNLLRPAGMSRRGVMRALGAAGLGASALAAGAGRAFAQDRTLNYFTWSSWGEGPFVEDAKKSGLVASLIEKHKVKGLSVAPPA